MTNQIRSIIWGGVEWDPKQQNPTCSEA